MKELIAFKFYFLLVLLFLRFSDPTVAKPNNDYGGCNDKCFHIKVFRMPSTAEVTF
jgi:hypothetical protein